jgi:glycosyltransferase involved in cell wall biosynthesis
VNNSNLSSSSAYAKPDISAIMPVYNEAGKVGRVLDVLREVDSFSEIIVVNDGSTDSTLDELNNLIGSDPRLRLLTHPVNQGKGQAIFTGWQATNSMSLLFLDSDLFGLQPQHVKDLMHPVIEDQADMSIGQFCNGGWISDWPQRFTPWLSGQRCLRSELLGQISVRAAEGYGIETALTVAAGQLNWRCVRVPLSGVWHLPGEVRRGLWLGLKTRARMYKQIVSAWYLAGGPHRFGLRTRVR